MRWQCYPYSILRVSCSLIHSLPRVSHSLGLDSVVLRVPLTSIIPSKLKHFFRSLGGKQKFVCVREQKKIIEGHYPMYKERKQLMDVDSLTSHTADRYRYLDCLSSFKMSAICIEFQGGRFSKLLTLLGWSFQGQAIGQLL